MMIGFSVLNWKLLTQHVAETRPDHPDPSLQTRRYQLPYETFFTTVLELLENMDHWKIVGQDRQTGEIQVERQSRLFHFIDDIRIKVSIIGKGQLLLNLRSISRVGKGDFGQNARNIRDFFEQLDHKIGTSSARNPLKS